MRKVKRILILTIVLVYLCSSTSLAYTAEELYADVGIEYTDPHSEEDIAIITAYKCAQRYVRIFSHLSNMHFDELDLSNAIDTLNTQLLSVEQQLNNGYNLSLDKIYELESEYRELQQAIAGMCEMDEAQEVPLRKLDIDSIPSYTEFVQANARNTLVDTRIELGNGVPSLTPNAYVISDETETTLTIGTSELAIITSLFNGEVVGVSDNTVTVNHYNGIFTSYRGVIPDVKIGDRVYQGMCIGYSSGTVSVRMRVSDVFVDISGYLKGVE